MELADVENGVDGFENSTFRVEGCCSAFWLATGQRRL
jgi:hypothetical protein